MERYGSLILCCICVLAAFSGTVVTHMAGVATAVQAALTDFDLCSHTAALVCRY